MEKARKKFDDISENSDKLFKFYFLLQLKENMHGSSFIKFEREENNKKFRKKFEKEYNKLKIYKFDKPQMA